MLFGLELEIRAGEVVLLTGPSELWQDNASDLDPVGCVRSRPVSWLSSVTSFTAVRGTSWWRFAARSGSSFRCTTSSTF